MNLVQELTCQSKLSRSVHSAMQLLEQYIKQPSALVCPVQLRAACRPVVAMHCYLGRLATETQAKRLAECLDEHPPVATADMQ